MKLEEQFRELDSLHRRNRDNVKIAENFAIGFSEWKSDYDYDGFLSTKQLLEIYKETL